MINKRVAKAQAQATTLRVRGVEGRIDVVEEAGGLLVLPPPEILNKDGMVDMGVALEKEKPGVSRPVQPREKAGWLLGYEWNGEGPWVGRRDDLAIGKPVVAGRNATRERMESAVQNAARNRNRGNP